MRTSFSAADPGMPALPKVDAVVVGASAGGVEALLRVFRPLRRGFRLPIIVVLHLPDERRSLLAEVFGSQLNMPVKEADDKEPIVPGTLYFAAPGYHLSVERDLTFSFSQEERVYHSRPSVDILFESAADAYENRLAGVLLTGANNDGAKGIARIAEYGGLSVVQDPAQALARAMPDAALALHTPDFLLSLADIGLLLIELERIAC
ncbi:MULTISPECIES: chemotaxis protein CheB [unclassified Pseudomonas]|uniref:chemotaxis protein CheB n=1 Tax=unclassified Pseudomonas TaxID=196821 RepID=UPI000D37DFF6|nr:MULTISPECIES: chemotaxis protein CheB [unclassified Pseudomonas]RAU48085.1 chemotaxis protein CheB [Pseudomonas sp. RIT 409]RAU55218.1 chemotaxis protein CheB [Pseudomonas sp. RIT 412]